MHGWTISSTTAKLRLRPSCPQDPSWCGQPCKPSPHRLCPCVTSAHSFILQQWLLPTSQQVPHRMYHCIMRHLLFVIRIYWQLHRQGWKALLWHRHIQNGLYIFNYDYGKDVKELDKFKLSLVVFVHAFVSPLVFMVFAATNSNVQSCFFPEAGANESALMVNLPLGAGLLSSFLFTLFPTRRRGIGY